MEMGPLRGVRRRPNMRTKSHLVIATALVAGFSSCKSAPPTGAASKDDASWLASGDTLRVTTDQPSPINGTYEVGRSDGQVRFATLGDICVAGLTRPELETLLEEKLGTRVGHGVRVGVTVAPGAPMTYAVLGAVTSAGPTRYEPDLTVLEAVERAQPDSTVADLRRVRLVRTLSCDAFEQTIDVERMLRTGDSTMNVHLQAGDVLFVPARSTEQPR